HAGDWAGDALCDRAGGEWGLRSDAASGAARRGREYSGALPEPFPAGETGDGSELQLALAGLFCDAGELDVSGGAGASVLARRRGLGRPSSTYMTLAFLFSFRSRQNLQKIIVFDGSGETRKVKIGR